MVPSSRSQADEIHTEFQKQIRYCAMKKTPQHRLIACLFSAAQAPPLPRKTPGMFSKWLSERLQPLSKIQANEILLFGKGLKRSHATIVATQKASWKLRIHLLLTRTPVQKLHCTDPAPMGLAQKKLRVDAQERLAFFITGNTTLVCSAKAGGTPTITYWTNTEKGCESVQRQHAGLACAASHVPANNLKHIPKILQFCHSDKHEALLQVTEIDHAGTHHTKSATLWLESVRLVNYASCLFHPSPGISDFPARLLRKVIAALDEKHISPLLEIQPLLEKWQTNRKPQKMPIHGDLWHSNALFNAQHQVCGVIDWEWFSEDGIPGFDAIHCLIISHAIIQKQSVFKTIRMVAANDEKDKALRHAIKNIATAHSFDHQDMGSIVCLVWLTVIYRSHVYTGPRSDQWISDAIHETAPFVFNSLINHDEQSMP